MATLEWRIKKVAFSLEKPLRARSIKSMAVVGNPQQDLLYPYDLALLQKFKTQQHGGCMCDIHI